MLPPERLPENQAAYRVPRSAKRAAVLALCYPDKDFNTKLLLILRPKLGGVHAAQVAFPGGGVEPNDPHLLATALRETHEEVGVSPNKIQSIRALTEIYIPPSNYHVCPFLAFSDRNLEFVPQPTEVAQIIEVPLYQLLDAHARTSCFRETSYAGTIEVPSFCLEGYMVWGATAMMLNELRLILQVV
ncbi:MAG: hypothetical protein RLZZ241_2600 [Bacteroidota bacterium]